MFSSHWFPPVTGIFAILFFGILQTSAFPQFPEALGPGQLHEARQSDQITTPTPGELLAAITRQDKPNWQSLYRKPIPTAYTSRPQIALNLGGLLADGYMAVQAEDAQQVKNIGKDIMTLAKTLGVSENVLRRGGSITDFAENNEWNALKEELEATQNEVRLAMQEMHDQELINLLTLGAWIRGTEAVTTWISDNYAPETAKLLRQPELIDVPSAKLDSLPAKFREDKLVAFLEKRLLAIKEMVSFARSETPTQDQVKALRNASQELIKAITEKK